MATSQMSAAISRFRRVMAQRDGAGLSDGQLLEGYLSGRDESALAALVQRHGPMVWGVCRRILWNHHDAEDAFQATFLVLVRKAASVASRELLANWLYGVAHQTALKARATAARRCDRERQVTRMPEPAVEEQDLWRDLQPLLDNELSRLPEKYRAVIVLCDLEGKTRKQAARQLRVPEGTVASRLATARRLLAKRLARHGLAVSGGALAAVLAETASAGAPSVVSGTIKAVTLVAAGQTAEGVISAKVAALTEGVLKAMLLAKLKTSAAVLFMLGMVAFGLLTVGKEGLQARAEQEKRPDARKDEKPRSDKERVQGTWKMVSCVADGEKDEDFRDVWTVKETTIKAMSPAKEKSGAFTSYIRFRLDETTNPKLIDLVEGQADDLFDTAKFDKRLDDADQRKEGIYSIAGDTLTICIGRKKGERPTTFVSKKGSGYLLIVLKREKNKEEKRKEKKGDKSGKQSKTVGRPKEGRIFFVRVKGAGQAALAMVNPDGKEEASLTEAGFHAVAPDGRQVAYAGGVSEDSSNKLEVFLKTVGEEKPGESLKVQGTCWCWSPDGRSLAITTLQGNALSHAIFDLETRKTRPLQLPEVEAPENAEGPVGHWITDWSKDGRWFLTTVQRGGVQTDLYRVKSDGSEAKKIGQGMCGRLSPDGKKILYLGWKEETPEKGRLFVADVDGGDSRQVSQESNGKFVGGYSWSPDGKKIAYVWQRDRDADSQDQETFLMVMDADGRNSTVILSEKITSTWNYVPFLRPDWR
jgi:RNA polymerase sigma factor (sigma-70 family)